MVKPTRDGHWLVEASDAWGRFRLRVRQGVASARIVDDQGEDAGQAEFGFGDAAITPPAASRTGGCGKKKTAAAAADPTPQTRIAPPGQWLAAAVFVTSLGFIRPCTACKSRAAAMDQAGWLGLPRLGIRWIIERVRP